MRVSGEPRLEHDPRVKNSAAHAADLVASYDYSDFLVRMGPVHDDQGTGPERPYDLVVRFDHGKIDAALRDLGGRLAGPAARGGAGARCQGIYRHISAERRGEGGRGAAPLAEAARNYDQQLRVPSGGELPPGAGARRIPEPVSQVAGRPNRARSPERLRISTRRSPAGSAAGGCAGAAPTTPGASAASTTTRRSAP